MILEISSKRRAEIKQVVLSTLRQYGDVGLPVKIGTIIRSMHDSIKLITYSSVMKKCQISYSEMVTLAGTEDAFCVFHPRKSKYCIFYNDIPPKIVKSNRVRWNLAHELGHILLGHHQLCGDNKLFRRTINDELYKQLEAEADYFAQLILVPHIVLYAHHVRKELDIQRLCKISAPAAYKRMREYKVWKRKVNTQRPYNDFYDEELFHIFYNYLYTKDCPRCGTVLVQRYGDYCPICGHTPLRKDDGKVGLIYPGIDLDDKGRAKECPVCKNENHPDDADYCKICGKPVVNYCLTALSDEGSYRCSRGNFLPGDARYCPYCGGKTTFLESGILAEWNKLEILPDDIPF